MQSDGSQFSPDLDSTAYESSLELSNEVSPSLVTDSVSSKSSKLSRYRKFSRVVGIASLVIIILVGLFVYLFTPNTKQTNENSSITSSNYAVTNVPLQGLKVSGDLQVGEASRLAINGQLQVNNTVVLSPTSTPSSPVTGQIYYNEATNEPYYYNGTEFVSLSPQATPQHVTSINGISGVLGVGSGLETSGNVLEVDSTLLQTVSNLSSGSYVTDFQGLSGKITLVAGPGIAISGTTISNSGVNSISSTSGNIVITHDSSGDYSIQDNSASANSSVFLAPSSSQIDSSNNTSIDVNKTGLGNFIDFQNNGTSTFVVGPTGAITTGTISYGQVQGAPTSVVNSIAGTTGALGLGAGLSVSGSNIENTGVVSVTGTANQINLSQSSGSVTLSLPQDIGTASNVQFNSLLLNTGLSLPSTGQITADNFSTVNNGDNLSLDASDNIIFSNQNGTNSFLFPTTGGANQIVCTSAGNCSGGGGSSGVSSINGQTGSITINNASAASGIVTLDNASTTQPGIAEFNSVNFTASGGVVDTIQDISTTSNPVFASVNGTSGLYTGSGVGTERVDASGNLVNINDITTTGTINGQTINTTANFTGTLTVQGASTTVGTTTQAGTLILNNGAGGSNHTATIGTINTLGQNTTYDLPDPGAANATICLSSGNCAGSGGGVTTSSSGVANTIAMFTGTSTVADSILSQNAGATMLTVGGNLTVGSSGTGTITSGAINGATISGGTLSGGDVSAGTVSGGSLSATAVNGLNVSGGTIGAATINGNLTGSGSPTLTSFGTINGQTINTTANFTGTLTVQGASTTVGTTTQAGTLILNNGAGGSNHTATIGTINTLGQNTTYDLPDPGAANATICLSSGNCAGSGGGVTTSSSGVANTIAMFTGTSTVADSILSQNAGATMLTVGGNLTVGSSGTGTITSGAINGATISGGTLSGGDVSAGTVSGGSLSATAVNGLNVSGGTIGAATINGNLTGSGSPTLTSFGTINGQTINTTANFTGTLTVQGASTTVGTTTQAGTLILNNGAGGSNHTATIGTINTLGQNTTYDLPDPGAANATICLSSGNCAGSGGGVTTSSSGVANTIAMFTGTSTVADSILSQNAGATMLTVGGNLTVGSSGTGTITSGAINGATISGGTLSGGDVSAGTVSGGSLSATAVNGLNVSGGTIGAATINGNLTGSGSPTLTSFGTINGQTINTTANFTGTLTVQGASTTVGTTTQAGTLILNNGAGGSNHTATIGTINTLGQNTTYDLPDPGAANATICLSSGNCAGSGGGVTTSSSGVANTIAMFTGTSTVADSILSQNAGATMLTVGGNLTVGSSGTGTITSGAINGATISGGTLSGGDVSAGTVSGGSLSATAVNGLNVSGGTIGAATINGNLTGSGSPTLTSFGTINGQTINTTANFTGTLTVQGASTTVGTTTQAGTLILNNGAGGSNHTATIGTINTLGQNTTYDLPDPGAANATICLSSGNCAGSGGGVTTSSSGVANTIAMFTGTSTVADSILSQNAGATMLTVGGNLTVGSSGTGTITSGAINGATISGGTLSGGDVSAGTVSGGSLSATAVNGLNVSGGTIGAATINGNLTGSGSPTLTSFGTINGQTINTTANFTGTLTVQGASTTVGTTTQAGTLILNNGAGGSNHTATIGTINTLGQNTTYDLPDPGAANATICLSSGNCAGSGGGVTTSSSGVANTIAMFTGTSTVADSILSQNAGATMLTVGGNLTVGSSGTGTITSGAINGATISGGTLSGGDVSAGTVSGGSLSATAVNGLNVSGGTIGAATINGNLTGSGSPTLTSFGTINGQTINTTANFTGTLTVQGASTTVGTTTQAGTLILNNGAGGSNHTATIGTINTLGQNTTYDLPDPGAANATICLSSGNCAGSGGGVTGSGISGVIAEFNGTSTITSSLLSDDGSAITDSGNLLVQGSGGLTLGTSAGNAGSVAFYNSAGTHTVSLTAPTVDPTTNLVFSLPDSYGANGDCLQTDGGGGLSFQACSGGGGSSGVSSINGQTGSITINNASAASGIVTLDNASTTQPGIAEFNSVNFTASGGVVDTIQDISTTSNPVFASVNGTSGLYTGSGVGTERVDASGNLVNINDITTTGTINGQTINTTANFTGTLTVQGASTTVGTTTQAGTLILNNGAGGSNHTATIGTINTLGQNTTYDLPDPGAANATICLSSGNCAGSGGGVTTSSSGVANTIAMFTGTSTVADSILSQNAGATMLTVGGNLTVGSSGTGTITSGAINGATISGGTLSGGDVSAGTVSGGSLSATAVNGLNVSGGTIGAATINGNLTGSGSPTLTSFGTINGQTINTTANFTGTLTVQGASTTVGTTTQAGTLILNNGAGGSNHTATIGTINTLGQNTTYDLPDPGAANATICLSSGNCAGSGGGVTTSSSGVANTIAMFTGTSTVADSILSQNAGATMLTVGGNLTVGSSGTGTITSGAINGATISGGTLSGGDVSAGTVSGGSLSATAVNGLNVSGGTIGAATINGNLTGSGSPTLTSFGTINGQTINTTANFTGTLTVQGASTTVGTTTQAGTLILNNGAGGSNHTATIGTINTLGQNTTYDLPDPGAANATICLSSGNCAGSGGGVTTSSSGVANTIAMFTGTSTVADSILSQNAGATMLTVGGNLTVGSSGTGTITSGAINGATISGGTLSGGDVSAGTVSGGSLSATAVNGLNVSGGTIGAATINGNLTGSGSPTLTSFGTINGQTINTTANFTGTLTVQGASTTVGTTTQAGTLILNNGAGGSNHTATIGTINTLGQNTTYDLPDPGAANATICLSSGNCAGSGGGVTTSSSGVANTIAMFTGTSTVADSILSQNAGATMLTVGGNLTVGSSGTGTITSGAINGATISGGTLSGGDVSAGTVSGGSLSATAVNGLNVSGGTIGAATINGNLTGSGSPTLTSFGTINGQTINTTANFTGTLTVQGASTTVGTTTQAGTLILNNGAGGSNHTATIGTINTLGQNTTYDLPDPGAANATICLSSGNCAGSGGGVTTSSSGVANTIAMFTGTSTVADSILSQNAGATMLTVGGNLTVGSSGTGTITSGAINGATISGGTLSGGDVSAGTVSGGSLSATAVNGLNVSGGTIGAATINGNLTGSGSPTLTSFGTINGQTINTTANFTGTLTVQGASTTVGTTTQAGTLILNNGAGGSNHTATIGTINTLGQNTTYDLPDPGAANATICLSSGNCAGSGGGVTTSSSGVANTIAMFTGTSTVADSILSQNAGATMLTVGGNLTVGSSGTGTITSGAINGATISGGTLSGGDVSAGTVSGGSLSATAVNGLNVSGGTIGAATINGNLTGSGSPTLTSFGTINGQTINTTANFTGTLTVQGASTTVGTTTQAGTLILNNGAGGSNHTATIGTINTLGQNTTYDLPDPGAANATICLSSGNCAGSGGGVTTSSSGVANTIAMFTGTSTVADSILSQNAGATMLTVGGNLTVGSSGTGTITSGAINGATISGGTLSGGDVSAGTVSGGSLSATAVNGLNVSGGTIGAATINGNLTGSGSPTLTSFGTINGQTINTTANFTGTLTVQGASTTVGTTTQAGTLILNNGAGGSNHTATIGTINTLGQNTTYDLPDPGAANATICLSSGNCAGSGGGVTTSSSGVANTIAMFTGTSTVADSILSQNAGATMLTVGGNLTVGSSGTGTITSGAINGATISGGTLSGGDVSAGTVSGGSLSATAVNGLNVSGGTIGAATINGNLTGSGSPTLTSFGTINGQTINTTANFTGTLTVQGASTTVGTTTQAGTLILNNGAGGSNHTATIGTINTLGQNTTYDLPDPGAANATICLSSGNCAGSGGGVTTSSSGVANTIAMFTGTSTVADSILSQNAGATMLTVGGNLTVGSSGTGTITSGAINGATISGGTLSGGDVSAGTVSGGSLSATAVNGLNVSASTVTATAGLTISSATGLTLGNGTSTSVSIQAASTDTISIGTTTNPNNVSIGSGAITSGTDTINIGNGATSSGVDAVTVGSTNSTSSTSINGGNGSNALSLQAATSGTISLGTSNVNSITIGDTGNTTGTNPLTLQSGNITQTITGASSNPTDVIEGNSTGLLQVQNTSGYAVLTANTSIGQVALGTSSHLNGSLAFEDSSDSNNLTLSGGSGGTLNTTVTGSTTSYFGAPTTNTYSTFGINTKNTMTCTQYTFGSRLNGTATSMTVDTNGIVGSGQSYNMAIYTGNGIQPTTEIASTASGTLTTQASAGVNTASTLTISATLVANTQYWLCENTSSTTAEWAANLLGTTTDAWSISETSGTWPGTITSGTGVSSQGAFDIIMNYTVAAAGTSVESVSNTGQTNIQDVNNNSSSLNIQDSAGESIFNVSSGGTTSAGVNINDASLNLIGLANPSNVVTTGTTGGSLSTGAAYIYYVDAVDAQGNHTQATIGSPGYSSGFDAYTTTWSAVSGAVSYTVYMTDNYYQFYSVSVSSGTTSITDNGTLFSAAEAAVAGGNNGDLANPSLYSNNTSGLNLQNDSAISFGGTNPLNSPAAISDTDYGQLLLDNSVSGGSVLLQADNFIYQNDVSGLETFEITNGGAVTGSTDVVSTSTAGTDAVSTGAMGYYLDDTSGTHAVTFNITGLPNTEGTIAYITAVTSGGATTVQINSSTILASFTSNQKSFIAMYLNGTWQIMGYGNTAATGARTYPTADYAEWVDYSGDSAPQPGDVLTVGDDDTSVKDSTSAYDNELMGVVSTSPYDVGSADDGHSVILSLTGRVPVKVSLENGPIEPGDPLTSSSTPGVAMKATKPGDIIGTALEAYDGTQSSNEINVQLHVGYDDPNPGQIQGDEGVSGSLTVDGDISTSGDLAVAGTTTTQNLNVTGSASVAGLSVVGLTSTGSLTVTGTTNLYTLTVSGSASIAGDLTLGGHLVTSGNKPTATINAQTAGSVSACTVSGDDTSGTITIQANGSSLTAGQICTITFAKAFNSVPNPVLSPTSGPSAAASAYVDATTSLFNLYFSNAPTSGQTYTFNYFSPQ